MNFFINLFQQISVTHDFEFWISIDGKLDIPNPPYTRTFISSPCYMLYKITILYNCNCVSNIFKSYNTIR